MPESQELAFPWWSRALEVVPIAAGVLLVLQHRAAPEWRTIALTFVAVAIFTTDEFCRGRSNVWMRVPRVVVFLPVQACVLALVWHPAQVDVAPFLLVLAAIYAGVAATAIDSAGVALLSAAVMVGIEASGRFTGSSIWVLAIALGWAGGCTMRWALTLLQNLRDAQADLAERAALDERQRIAREIHDVLAHSMSVATLHITGARMALKRDPAEAADALEQAERLARESMNQVRTAIGTLAPDADQTAPSLPTAEDIGDLVEEFRRAGAAVTLRVEGDLGAVPAPLGLALYRVAQESLTNAVRHAPGQAAAVELVIDDAGARLSVTNAAAGATPKGAAGRGIVGMRERVRALGGSFDAGRERDVWRVRMSAPRAAAP